MPTALGKSPFEVVHTKHPKHGLDLVPLPRLPILSLAAENMAELVQQIQEDVHLNLEQANNKYKAVAYKKQRVKTFQEGDLVVAHLWKSRSPTWTYGKLKSCKYGSFWMTRKKNDNAYIVELPNMLISNTFNAADLFKYHLDDPLYGYKTWWWVFLKWRRRM